MFATSLALIAQTFRGPSRGVAFGVFGAISGIAVAVGPVLGGALTSGLSWRWIFFVNIPIGVAVIAITLLRVEESRNPLVSRPDWLGFLSFSSALGALVCGLIQAGSHSLGSARVLASLIAAAVLLGAFVAVELWQRAPMFDFGLLRNRTFVGGLCSAFAFSPSALSSFTFLVLYLQNVLGCSAIATGVRLLAMTGSIFLTASLAGRLTSKLPARFLIGPAEGRSRPEHRAAPRRRPRPAARKRPRPSGLRAAHRNQPPSHPQRRTLPRARHRAAAPRSHRLLKPRAGSCPACWSAPPRSHHPWPRRGGVSEGRGRCGGCPIDLRCSVGHPFSSYEPATGQPGWVPRRVGSCALTTSVARDDLPAELPRRTPW